MQFIVNRAIGIDAESPEEALEKTKPTEGTSLSFTVNPMPPQPQIGPRMGGMNVVVGGQRMG